LWRGMIFQELTADESRAAMTYPSRAEVL